MCVFANTPEKAMFNKLKIKVASAGAALLAAPAAFAGQTNSSGMEDAFQTYYDTVKAWTGGALGMGLATTMLLMGGAMGVARNSPMPALSGIAGAAFLKWGPDVIYNIMKGGLI